MNSQSLCLAMYRLIYSPQVAEQCESGRHQSNSPTDKGLWRQVRLSVLWQLRVFVWSSIPSIINAYLLHSAHFIVPKWMFWCSCFCLFRRVNVDQRGRRRMDEVHMRLISWYLYTQPQSVLNVNTRMLFIGYRNNKGIRQRGSSLCIACSLFVTPNINLWTRPISPHSNPFSFVIAAQ